MNDDFYIQFTVLADINQSMLLILAFTFVYRLTCNCYLTVSPHFRNNHHLIGKDLGLSEFRDILHLHVRLTKGSNVSEMDQGVNIYKINSAIDWMPLLCCNDLS